MTSYTLKQLSDILGAKVMGDPTTVINHIWFDSRHIIPASQGLFFAIQGHQRDGSTYIQEVLDKGVKSFVVTKPIDGLAANFLIVEDVVKALQKWAAYHRKQFNGKVIGITGTHGKTIIKEWLYQLLYQDIKIIRSPKSYNSQIGVPLSVLQMEPSANMAIVELGISEPGEMETIASIVDPDIAVLSMVGNAHSEFFKSREQQVQEKMKLFEKAKTIIFPFDDTVIRNEVLNHYNKKNIISFGIDESANVQLLSGWNDSLIKIRFKNKFYKFQIPFRDEASIYNALVSFAVITQMPVDLDKISLNFSLLQPVEMRLAQREGVNQTVIIDDTYNSDLSSIPIALNVLKNHTYFKKTLILTDVLQDRLSPKELYKRVADWVNAYPIQKVILIGEEVDQFKHLFKNLQESYRDTASFISHLNINDFHDEVILLKGARKFGLENISKIFQQKSHDTVLEIDLDNLIHNLKYYKRQLKPTTKMMAMVKASGYGLGGVAIAQALMNHGIDYFGVAYADEGAELRKHGITQSIMVMNPEQSSYDTMIANQLEPEVYSFRMLDNFTEALIRHEIQVSYPVHIKLNTGMNRLGFNEEQISELIKRLADNPYVHVQSVFSHFATSDMPSEEDFVHKQVAVYKSMYQKLSFNLGYEPTRHIANSAAILNYPEYQMDMVRLGIGMYGIGVDAESDKFLKNVATFKTVVSQIHDLKVSETVSYGRHFKADKPTRIATLPVGYADGVKRILSNERGYVAIKGKLVPIIGNICMDMIMVNITGIKCREGDEVIIFGENPTVNQVAAWSSTIPYEILTSISSRVKRIYVQNG
ncbi:MAG: bifunctional UDP-N-acetylmuramoyl-tripeptide:D-alanyl-D-alanine ligase/alanine racemase [Weeksellaceae bacterium]